MNPYNKGLNPTGAPAPVGHTKLDKGAVTRFNNDHVAAARNLMQNDSAAQSFRPQVSGHKKPTISSAPKTNSNPLPVTPQQNSVMPDQLLQTGPVQPIDPITQFQSEIRMNEFLKSPEFGDALTKQRLKDMFRGGDGRNPELAKVALGEMISKFNERGLR